MHEQIYRPLCYVRVDDDVWSSRFVGNRRFEFAQAELLGRARLAIAEYVQRSPIIACGLAVRVMGVNVARFRPVWSVW